MTDRQKLYEGIGRAAWGYFFAYINLKFNNVSFTPSFIGFILFLSAINLLCEEERELGLLRTLGVILTIWHTISWVASLASIDIDGMFRVADIIIEIVNIYFLFQFVTNLASIAEKYQAQGYDIDAKLLAYRSTQTVMLTGVIVATNYIQGVDILGEYTQIVGVYVSIITYIMYFLVIVLMMKALFDLRGCLRQDTEG